MAEVGTIVVGIDGSDGSRAALDWAVAEAKRTGGRLLLVHVWHWVDDVMAAPLAPTAVEGRERQGREMVRRLAREVGAQGVPVSTRVVHGWPVAGLIEADPHAAMIVVGRHGRGAVAGALMGSVSQGCVHRATCPVVVVPAAGDVLADSDGAAADRKGQLPGPVVPA